MRVLHVNLLLAVLVPLALLAAPAQAAPISAHAMLHTCCTPDTMKERIFGEAEAVGADFVRVDVEMGAIFEGPGGQAKIDRLTDYDQISSAIDKVDGS